MWSEKNQVKYVGIKPAHGGTQVAKYRRASNETAIIHTVTTGKTFYLTLCVFSIRPEVAGLGYILIRDTADVTVEVLASFQRLIDDGVAVSLPFFPPLEIPAGYDIVIYSSAATCYTYGFVHGWEE